MSPRSALTWLFVPGDRSDRFAKAAAAGADIVILDLQDAVAASAKHSARRAVIDWLSRRGSGVVRINPVRTAEGQSDLAALDDWFSEARDTSALSAVMVPQAESVDDLDAVARILPGIALVPLVESARGLLNLRALCSHPAVARISFGNLDTAADLGCAPESAPIQHARVMVVLESRAADLPAPIDGVTPDFADAMATTTDATAARALGFGGKLCIHPSQCAKVVAAFTPTAEEISWANKVDEAIASADGGVVSLDGVMLDAPVLRRARNILARSGTEA